ncbi:hypothetical protein F5883DRAFT_536981 [Diaporthe sp. PMI_573]|nr:hypothetical protein F5883DRAFT_536981 [Diaporthaceae sp. PMI_573]
MRMRVCVCVCACRMYMCLCLCTLSNLLGGQFACMLLWCVYCPVGCEARAGRRVVLDQCKQRVGRGLRQCS